MRYFPTSISYVVEILTNSELDPLLWRDDAYMDVCARAFRDQELFLDLTGNLDADV